MSKQPHVAVVHDFSGGRITDPPANVPENVLEQLYALWHHTGRLKTMQGRQLMNATEMADYPVKSLFYYSNGTNDYLLAKCGTTVWVGKYMSSTVQSAVSAGTGKTVTWATSTDLPHTTAYLINHKFVVTGTNRNYGASLTNATVPVAISAGDTISTWHFVPLAMHAHRDSDTEYLAARAVNGYENFLQIGDYVYIASEDAAQQTLRWDGFLYTTGRAMCTAYGGLPGLYVATDTVTGYDCDWSDVRQGDILYIYDHDAGAWMDEGYTIKSVDSTTQLTLESTANTWHKGYLSLGPVEPYWSQCDYCIVRVHRMGVPAGDTATATCIATGGALAAGTTYYKYRYRNSETTYTGNVSLSGSVNLTGGTLTAHVAGWSARPTNRSIDQVEIFRSTDAANYYLAKRLTASSGDYNIATAWDDMGTTSLSTALEWDADYHTQIDTGRLGKMIWWNNRLYAIGRGPYATRLYASTLNYPEYFPSFVFTEDAASATAVGVNLGFREPLTKSIAEPLMDIVPEGGSYDSTGRQGTNLLVFTNLKAKRWYGTDWSDFAVEDAFSEGAVSKHTACNIDGDIFWLSPSGPKRLYAGSARPIPIQRKLWPSGLVESMKKTPKTTYLKKWCGVPWQDYYVLAGCIGQETKNTRLYLYHIPTDTWTCAHEYQHNLNADCLMSYAGPSGDTGELVMGDSVNGYVYKLFSKVGTATDSDFGSETRMNPIQSGATAPTSVHFRFMLPPSRLVQSPDHLYRVKTVKRVQACALSPQTDQSIRLEISADGDYQNPDFTAVQTLSAGDGRVRRYLEWSPVSVDGRQFSVAVSGTVTRECEFEWVALEYTLEGDGSMMESR